MSKQLHLTPIEFKLLCLLSKNVGESFDTYLFDQMKSGELAGKTDMASLRVFMATLRKKLEAKDNSAHYIQTHIGVGYRMLKVE